MNDSKDNHMDDHVDEEIKYCLDLKKSKSFFTCAGAGSGKTRSLIKALCFIEEKYRDEFELYRKRVVVITYTNAAVEEIKSRLHDSSVFQISTIHSFLWELIKNHQKDIKNWVISYSNKEIIELLEKESKGRSGTAASRDRIRKIENYRRRIERLQGTCKIKYNPMGENIGFDSLSHAEVIKIGSEFIQNYDLMKKIMVCSFPFIFIDECQDTKRELVDALINLSNEYKDKLVIGMFGDTMQRIYSDGKDNLQNCISDEWVKPIKEMNHRSAKRIVELANSIRKDADEIRQLARKDAELGCVRLFIANQSADKITIERNVVEKMQTLTNDQNWKEEYKALILEHHMAGKRLRFVNFFEALYSDSHFAQGVLDGTIPEVSFFINCLIPLVEAEKNGNKFESTKILRKYSHIISKQNLLENKTTQRILLQNCCSAVNSLMELWEKEENPSCLEILRIISRTNLFEISDRIERVLEYDGTSEDVDHEIISLYSALSLRYNEIYAYSKYISDRSQYGTHQGVKGLEFPRVMVIMDDSEAKGFMFSYGKLFGDKEQTDTDIKNEKEGKDSSIARTRRLFYVACTRAEKSLAVVAYAENPELVRTTAIENLWFTEAEVEIIQ